MAHKVFWMCAELIVATGYAPMNQYNCDIPYYVSLETRSQNALYKTIQLDSYTAHNTFTPRPPNSTPTTILILAMQLHPTFHPVADSEHHPTRKPDVGEIYRTWL